MAENRFGYRGVHKRCNKWIAQISVNRQTIILGRYDTPEKAHQAYLEAKKTYLSKQIVTIKAVVDAVRKATNA